MRARAVWALLCVAVLPLAALSDSVPEIGGPAAPTTEAQSHAPEAADDGPPEAIDPVLYAYLRPEGVETLNFGVLMDGIYGEIFAIQSALNTALDDCGLDTRIETDGAFGVGTRQAIQTLMTCEAIRQSLPPGSAAHQGAVTEALWRLLLPARPVPDVPRRLQAILQAFEGTPFHSPARWNFCQNTPVYDPEEDQFECYSNDPRSYLTWGPNGATAGWGQELLIVLSLIDAQHGDLLDAAFGDEAPAVRRSFRLGTRTRPIDGTIIIDDSEIERYLCSVFIDKERRDLWSSGFASLAANPEAREIYSALFRANNFDGGKIGALFRAWHAVGLDPTEIDFAFFVDRAAHTSVRFNTYRVALERIRARHGGFPSPAEIRRQIARDVRPRNRGQRLQRRGRDVAFYYDALGSDLNSFERRAWRDRGRRRAAAIGLSDDRPAPDFEALPNLAWVPTGDEPLSAEERDLCPDVVLNPRPQAESPEYRRER